MMPLENKEMNEEYIGKATALPIHTFLSFRTMYHLLYLMLTFIPQKCHNGSFPPSFYATKNHLEQIVSMTERNCIYFPLPVKKLCLILVTGGKAVSISHHLLL